MTKANYTHRLDNGVEASGSEPCLLCGREKYCYLIKDEQSVIYKSLCHWTDPHNPPDRWRHVGTATDGRPVFVKLGYQRQRRSKKYPEVIELKPQPKTDIPQWQDVQLSVEQVQQGHAVKLKPEVGLGSPDIIYEVQEIKGGKRQGQQTIMAVLTVKGSPYGGTAEVEFKDLSEVVTYDPDTGAKEQFIEYFYSETFKEVRHQWTDRQEVYNGKSKKIRPHRRLPDGSWTESKGNIQPPLYRQKEAEAAIKADEIVFAVGGPQAVECLRSIGLVAVCNQGGEDGYQQIARDLAPIFQARAEATAELHQLLALDAEAGVDVRIRKPLLVSFPDYDEAGRKTFGQGLPKECSKQGIPCIALDPLTLFPDMPPSGDAKEWLEYCQKAGISPEEMHRRLEFAIDAAIDRQEEELRLRWQRAAWKAPVSHQGEIGRWQETGKGEDAKKKWQPLCNFDFQVERELADAWGGGLVLQVKRSVEQRQYRVMLNSTDYTSVDKFVDALKVGLGVGIVCNLNKHDLGALIHERLHEYRTNRFGKVYKRIDRYGQQADGTWVFCDRQYTADGKPTSEEETGWVFNPHLGKEDYIPCPELAPADPKALERLVNAARRFYGTENFYQVLLTMGWVVAGLHFQPILQQEKCFPLSNSYGEPGSFKTLGAETALSLVGTNWAEMGMLARVSLSALYEHGSRTGSLPFFWDDPDRQPESEELAKSWYNAKPRKVRGNEQTPHSPMGITSNHIFGGDQSATLTRFVRFPYKRVNSRDEDGFQELKQAQRLASGAFARLIQIGYPKHEIAAWEQELLTHLPLAHARIAQSLAIATYYAQKLVEMTGGSEDVKQWAIQNLCDTENDAENVGDSLRDFVAKILSLQGQDLVGDWNKQAVSTKDGYEWVAIYTESVWGLVDRHFKPATYNKKSLKSLVLAAGGKVDSTQRFAASRDEVLTYYAAKINPRLDSDGNEIPPNLPRTITRKAWLLPMELFGGDTPLGDGGDGGSDYSPPLPYHPPTSNDLRNNYLVTAVTDELAKTVTSQNPDESLVADTFYHPVTTVTKKRNEIEIEQSLSNIETKNSLHDCHVANSGNSGNRVIVKAQTYYSRELQPVTDCVTKSGAIAVTTPAIAPTAPQQLPTGAITSQASATLPVKPRQEEEPRNAIAQATSTPATDSILEHNLAAELPLQVGERVWWDNCPGHCEQMNPFTIRSIDGDRAMLDYVGCPVPLAELRQSL